jgi:putative spermidine/putrescine transport system ATP-binding protein
VGRNALPARSLFNGRRNRMTAVDRSPPVTIRGIAKRYGNTTVLHGIDLDVKPGEFVTLLGPSGSGKTTILMILAGFVRPNAGSIKVGEEEIVAMPPHKRNVGMVFQNYALFPHMDVFQNVAFPLRQRGVASAEMASRVRAALDLVQLGDFAERRVDQLSGGQRQRVALARAIVFEPRILLMDEPLSALDKKLRERMQIEIRHLHERLGMTTIYVTHDQREAITMSDRVAVMNAGRIAQLDTPKGLYGRPQSRFVAEFIGESSFLPVERDGAAVKFGGQSLRMAGGALPGAGKQWLVLRPEKLSILNGQADPSLNQFLGQVKEVVYQGESFICYVTLPDGSEISVRNYSRGDALARLPEPGQPIRLGLSPEDIVLVPEEEAA